MAKKKEPNPVGRPSKYKPEFCEQLKEHMAKGYSFESFAGKISVDRDSLYEWVKIYPEFSDAKKEAFEKCLLWWETQSIEGLYNISETDKESGFSTSKTISASVYIFNMKNRFKWRDKLDEEKDDININVTLADRMAKARARTGKK